MIAAGTTPHGLLREGVWRVDRSHSQLGFAVRHLGVATVRGAFRGFGGELLVAPDGVHVAGRAESCSVDTGETVRDERLRDELFAADRFPRIELAGEAPRPARGKVWRVPCTLTIRGVARAIVLHGDVEAHDGDVRVVLEGAIRRSDFGLDWPALGEAGRRLIGDRVRLRADVMLTHAATEEAR